MATKRACKLQEFVAHASDVNCAKFGRWTSRILITGGEDQVNVWAVGKPSAILSLSGLTGPVESVSFDSTEVMIGAGAANVEKAKVVRTFTGHRSNCASLDFHPFGEFFASGSSDTNMKIWDMRKKRCIHTYQGHTRRINALRFSPDGRWIVSGGADNSVKIWDLTAGKLLHDFRLHEGPVNCLDFHPHEFLLATGSADKTVKFWDLETFELIGSSEPENCREYFVPASVVRSMTFNSDGKALFCGLHESLKVLSWEPVICHDVVDVGWSTLADLSVQEGKILGCSYNKSCIGIWVVDLTKIEPYAADNAESVDTIISSMLGKLSVSKGSEASSETPSNMLRKRPMASSKEIPVAASPAVMKRLSKAPETSDLQLTRAGSAPLLPPREASSETPSNTLLKRPMSSSKEIPVVAPAVMKRLSKAPETSDLRLTRAGSAPLLPPRGRFNPNSTNDLKRLTANVRSHVDLYTSARMSGDNSQTAAAPTYRLRSNVSAYSSKGPSFVPVVFSRHSSRVDDRSILTESTTTVLPTVDPENPLKGHLIMDHGEEVHQCVFSSKCSTSTGKYVSETPGDGDINYFVPLCVESVESNEVGDWYDVSGLEETKSPAGRNPEFMNVSRTAVFVGTGRLHRSYDRSQDTPTLKVLRRHSAFVGEQSMSVNDEDVIAVLMENHQEFIHGMTLRSTKLEMVCRCWQNNDTKGSFSAMRRMLDHAVTADILSVLVENTTNYITLDICTSVLPLACSLLESSYDRHVNIGLGMTLKLVRSFGATISSTLSAAPPVGVDLKANQRLERCNLCFGELKKLNAGLISLASRAGKVGRLARELSLFLQDIFRLPSGV